MLQELYLDVQFELLMEIGEKSEALGGKTMVELNLDDDPKRKYNFEFLKKNNPSLFCYVGGKKLDIAQIQKEIRESAPHNKSETRDAIIEYNRSVKKYPCGLTLAGHIYLADLKSKVEKSQWEKDQNKRDKERDERDKVRFRYDGLAVTISIIAIVIAIATFFKSFF